MRLIDCLNGSKVKILSIDAGKGAELNLMNLGLNIGDIITVSKRSRLRGPVVIINKDSEIAIGHGLAEKILVEGL
ncbi:MAG: ferrous iron transport protein A [Melioribacteraceae bacterium]|jgi:ferrous iron transport protein A|nr:ferrous iron transport protein A [Melioribacteraceae bacterium]